MANGAAQKITKLQGLDTTVWLMVLVTPIEVDDAEIRFAYTHPKAEPGSRGDRGLQDRLRTHFRGDRRAGRPADLE